jgi:nicotinamide-nucleotide amidase
VLAQHALDPLGETLVTHTTLLPSPAGRQSCGCVDLDFGRRGVFATDLTVAVIGVGGPGPQDGVPPGTVWTAVHDAGRTSARCFSFDGDPAAVVGQTCDAAIDGLAGARA